MNIKIRIDSVKSQCINLISSLLANTQTNPEQINDFILLLNKQTELVDTLYTQYNRSLLELKETKQLLSNYLINDYKKKINNISNSPLLESRVDTCEELIDKLNTHLYSSKHQINKSLSQSNLFPHKVSPSIIKKTIENSFNLNLSVNFNERLSKFINKKQEINEKDKSFSNINTNTNNINLNMNMNMNMETINELFDSEFELIDKDNSVPRVTSSAYIRKRCHSVCLKNEIKTK